VPKAGDDGTPLHGVRVCPQQSTLAVALQVINAALDLHSALRLNLPSFRSPCPQIAAAPGPPVCQLAQGRPYGILPSSASCVIPAEVGLTSWSGPTTALPVRNPTQKRSKSVDTGRKGPKTYKTVQKPSKIGWKSSHLSKSSVCGWTWMVHPHRKAPCKRHAGKSPISPSLIDIRLRSNGGQPRRANRFFPFPHPSTRSRVRARPSPGLGLAFHPKSPLHRVYRLIAQFRSKTLFFAKHHILTLDIIYCCSNTTTTKVWCNNNNNNNYIFSTSF